MYSVSINNTWTTDGKATVDFFVSKGCVVQESRLAGDSDVFLNGKKIAIIFDEKKAQIEYLKTKGIIG